MSHNDKEKLIHLRAKLMARATEMQQRGALLAESKDITETCAAIQSSGHAQGIIEAVNHIDEFLVHWTLAANDNAQISGGDIAS